MFGDPRQTEDEDWWAKLGALLKSGGMNDPAFLYGMVEAEVAMNASRLTGPEPTSPAGAETPEGEKER